MSCPEISVVLTTYNRPTDVLLRAVHSVENQSFTDFELAIVNDCPENEKLASEIKQKVTELGDDRIRYFDMPCNGGACRARNFGAEKTIGKFIAFLDDDDEWVADKLKMQHEALRSNSKAALVYSSLLCERANGEWVIGNRNPKPAKALERLLVYNYIGPTSSPLIKRAAYESVGGFDTAMRSCQDYDLWIRLVAEYDICYIDSPLVKYYDSGDSTFKRSPDKYYESLCRIIEKNLSFYQAYPKAYSETLNRMASEFLVSYRDFEKYLALKRRALGVNPVSPWNYFGLLLRIIRKVCK